MDYESLEHKAELNSKWQRFNSCLGSFLSGESDEQKQG